VARKKSHFRVYAEDGRAFEVVEFECTSSIPGSTPVLTYITTSGLLLHPTEKPGEYFVERLRIIVADRLRPSVLRSHEPIGDVLRWHRVRPARYSELSGE
jgi:hypothetical protein